MPIGLTMNYVVFRKDRLEAARMAALGRHDLQAAEYIDNIKLNGVQDEHLLGLESMAPFEDEDFAMWTERLGLPRNPPNRHRDGLVSCSIGVGLGLWSICRSRHFSRS